jgi:sensor c-di-GMP phosphodiesterase-like protein
MLIGDLLDAQRELLDTVAGEGGGDQPAVVRRVAVHVHVMGPRREHLRRQQVAVKLASVASLLTTSRGSYTATFAAEQGGQPGKAEQLETLYHTDPAVRHGFRVSAWVWGLGLLTEALIRAPLIYLLPIDVMVGLSTALSVVTIGGLIIWHRRYFARRHCLLGTG